MVKKFIQTIEAHGWFRRLRQVLAVTLIFSMLAPDIAQAMESDADETKVIHSIPPFLKGPSKAGTIISSEDQKPLNTSTISLPHIDDAETHILQFANQSSGSDEDQSKEISFGSAGSSPEKPQTQSSANIPFVAFSILPSVSQDIPPVSFLSPSLFTSIGNSIDSRSLQDREPSLPLNSNHHSDQSGDEQTICTSAPPPISHPLDIDSDYDEENSLLGKQHHQNKAPISIKQYGSTVQVSFSKDGIGAHLSVDFVDLGFPSEIFPSSHSNQQPDQAGTKKLEQKPLPRPDNLTLSDRQLPVSSSSLQAEKQRKLKELKDSLIGEYSETGLFFDSKDIRRANTSPISGHNLPSRTSSKDVVVNERSSLLRSQLSIQCNDHDTDRNEDDEISIEIGYPKNPDELLHLEPSEDHSQYRSCCGRLIFPQRTKYTLPYLDQRLHKLSQLITLLGQEGYNPQGTKNDDSLNNSGSLENEGSTTLPNGTPPQVIREAGVTIFVGSDLDKDSVPSDEDGEVSNPTRLKIPQEGNRLGSFLLPNIVILSSHQLPPIDIETLEVGIPTVQISSFWEFIQRLPPNAKAQLQSFKHQILDDVNTWSQRIGKWIIGPAIGAPLAYAMSLVYFGGLSYLMGVYDWNWLANVEDGGFPHYFLLTYILSTLLPDAVPRNAKACKEIFTDFSQKAQKKLRIGLTFLACLLPSCIEPFYLVQMEWHDMNVTGTRGVNNQFAITMLTLCPILFIDSLGANFRTAWQAWDSIKEGIKIIQPIIIEKLCRQTIHIPLKSLEEIKREEFDKSLKKLSQFFFQAPSDEIDRIYADILQIKEGINEEFLQESEEDFTARQTFVVLSYLLSLGDEVVEGYKQAKSLYETLSDVLKYSCLTLGSPARLLVLQMMFETLIGIFAPKGVSNVLGWIFAFIGFPLQTGLEYQGMTNFSNDFLWEEQPNGYTSHPGARWTTKAIALWQGLFFTVPLLVLTLQTCNAWFTSGWWMLGSIPFLFPEFTTQVTSFNGTYNRQDVTAITNVHNKKTRKCQGKSPRPDWKRDQLIQLVQESQRDLNNWHPILIQKLQESLNWISK